MLRKIFSVTILLTLLLTACGQKLPEVDADKAVTAYAQLYTCGTIDDDLKHAVNLSDGDIAEARAQIVAPLIRALEQYPLADETIRGLTEKFLDRLQHVMDIKVKLKDGDKERPTVELVTTTINPATVEIFAEEDDGLNALKAQLAELKAQGLTDDEIKRNPEVQSFALDGLGKFLGDFNMNEKATILVPCKIVADANGKLYWQPEYVQAIARHITGQP